jgi:hypothetical protein
MNELLPVDQLATIRNEISRHGVAKYPDPSRIYELLLTYSSIMQSAAVQRQYLVLAKGMEGLDRFGESFFKHDHVAPVIADLYFEHFPASLRLVLNLAESLSGELRERLVHQAVDNLISHDVFRADSGFSLSAAVIRNLLRHCDDPAPALRFADSILTLQNSQTTGFQNILDAVTEHRLSVERLKPLTDWLNEKITQSPELCLKAKAGSATKENIAFFREAGLPSLADALYLRSKMVDARQLIDIHKRTGMKPDATYLRQFFYDGSKPDTKELRELLKYSLVVENVFPADWKGINMPWVTSSLADAFTRLSEAGIKPRSPEECEPLISQLADHIKGSESMKSLLNKRTEPYLKVSHKFSGKLFGQDLGL